MPAFPSIPPPIKGDDSSIHEALMAIKQAVEQLQGIRGTKGVTRTFVQAETPKAVIVGDLWVQTSNGTMSYWNGKNWIFVNIGA